MMNQTAEHAIRAIVYLAQQPAGAAVPAERIAEAIGAPANYLGKTLSALARQGLVTGSRGPGGGYRMSRPAREISFADVVSAFSEARPQPMCLLGDRPCSAAAPCWAHDRWTRLREEMMEPLARTTIADLLLSERGQPAGDTSSSTAGRAGGLLPIHGGLS
jgi:Rrf2 family iron-sulfur cluster assembly transcriptional regulator